MKYAASTAGFYDSALHGDDIPGDAVDITAIEHAALLAAQAEGQKILADAQGRPYAATPVLTLQERKAQLAAQATAHRWAVETGGIALPNGVNGANGVRVATAKTDQDRITSVLVNAQAAQIETVEFKAAGDWVTLTLAELQSIASAIARHVQACFAAERAHHEAIAALDSIAAVNAYDVAARWPSTPEPNPDQP